MRTGSWSTIASNSAARVRHQERLEARERESRRNGHGQWLVRVRQREPNQRARGDHQGPRLRRRFVVLRHRGRSALTAATNRSSPGGWRKPAARRDPRHTRPVDLDGNHPVKYSHRHMSTIRRQTVLAACAAAFLFGGASPARPRSHHQPAAPPAPALWGDMKPVVSVKELMEYMIDPASDYIFDSVSTVIDPHGKVIEKAPKTDEDWEKLRIGAVTLAEGVYLLKIPRPFTPPGDENHSGPDGTELTPAQITAKVTDRSGRVERQNRDAPQRRPSGPRDREDEEHERAVGRRRESR